MVYCFHPTEIRTHGVAYYQFATDEEKRQEQLAALNKLRDQVLSAIGYPQASLELIVGELINFQRAIQTHAVLQRVNLLNKHL